MMPEVLGPELDFSTLGQFTPTDFEQWLNERLAGDFTRFPAYQRKDPNPVNLFVQICRSPRISPLTRRIIATVLLDVYARRLFQQKEEVGTLEFIHRRTSVDSLSFLAEAVGFVAGLADESARNHLAEFIQSQMRRSDFATAFEPISRSIARSFLSLQCPADTTFWLHFASCNPECDVIAMQGLGKVDVGAMIDFICTSRHSQRLIETLPFCMEGIILAFGRPLLSNLVKDALTPHLASSVGSSLFQLFVKKEILHSKAFEDVVVADNTDNTLKAHLAARQEFSSFHAISGNERVRRAFQEAERFRQLFYSSGGEIHFECERIIVTTPRKPIRARRTIVFDFTDPLQKIFFSDPGFWLYAHEAFTISSDFSKCEVDVQVLIDKESSIVNKNLHLGGVEASVDLLKHLNRQWAQRHSGPSVSDLKRLFGSSVVFWIVDKFSQGSAPKSQGVF